MKLKKSAIAVAIVLCASAVGLGNPTHEYTARDGVLDLRSAVFDQEQPIVAAGRWSFYWGKLLTPDDFRAGALTPDIYAPVPGSWNDLPLGPGPPGAFGYATYRLVVLLPESMRGRYFSLSINQINSAYVLYLNGLRSSWGTVARSPERFIPDIKTVVETVMIEGDRLEIVIQCANFFSRKGGMVDRVFFGSSEAISRHEKREVAQNLFMFGSLLIIGIYLLSLYGLRRSDPSPLYFGLFCILFSLRATFDTYFFYTELFHGISWPLYSRLEYLVDYCGPVLIALFLRSLYPRELSRLIVLAWGGFTLVNALLVLAAPRALYLYTVIPFQAAVVLSAIYAIAAMVRAAFRRHDGAVIILLGMGGLIVTSFIEILYMNGLVLVANSLTVGIYMFIILLSFVISLRFSRAFATVERLSGELEEKNINLSRLDQLKDEFLANTSHELRTPLNGIIGLAENLLEGAGGPVTDLQRRHLSLLSSSGRRLAVLINDILDFSRLRNGDIVLVPASLDLHAIADIVIEQCRFLTGGRQLSLINDVPLNLPRLQADEERLQQILFNLVGNAVKFTEEGSVTVSAAVADGRAVVTVTDMGIGISPEMHERIFESFVQGDSTAARRYGGTGLGLAITRRLIELHGGTISLESHPGAGSCFSFSLPLWVGVSDADQLSVIRDADRVVYGGALGYPTIESPPEGSPLWRVADGGGVRVLVVDDDPVNLRVIADLLSMKGYRVVAASGGREALDLLQTDSFECVILDVMMPEVTGYDVLADVRRRYAFYDLPVILLTAKNQSGDLVTGLERGANDYLGKPIHREELLARIGTQVTMRRMVLDNTRYAVLSHEVRLARDIIRGLIPALPRDLAFYSLAALYEPSITLGGDFYDFYRADDGGIGILLADITGHGVPAALFAAMLKIIFQREREHARNPARLLSELNENITGVIPNLFLTAVYLYLDPVSGQAHIASAGHPPVLYLRHRDCELRAISLKGYLMGWKTEVPFESLSLSLEPGDRLVMYTDGITEARQGDRLFGDEVFREMVRTHAETSLEEFCALVYRAVLDFSGKNKLDDDITMIAVEVCPGTERGR